MSILKSSTRMIRRNRNRIKDGKIFNAIHYSHEKANDIELRYSENLASRHYHCDHYHRTITECVTS